MTGSVVSWLENRRAVSSMRVERLPWAQNPDWVFTEDALRHVSSGFFSIAGATQHWPGAPLDGADRPMIDQPDPGLLGFIAAPAPDGLNWLLQAKNEPGTIGAVQVGPTVQATQANYRQLHGGAPTQFLGRFADPQNPPLIDTLQSEQGTQFIGKANRNAVVLAAAPFVSPHPDWAWFATSYLRDALASDYAINTDARSVIVSAPWRLLASPEGLFSADARSPALSDFVAAARASHSASHADIAGILARLNDARRTQAATLMRKPLSALAGWRITDDGIVSADASADMEIVNYAIWATGREVTHWRQPLLCPRETSSCGLVFHEMDGRLKVFLRYAAEPGFLGRVELGTSWQSNTPSPAWITERIADLERAPLLAIHQSDEGGRFMRSIARYSLHMLDTPPPAGITGGDWVDIGELEALCARPMTLTNEARSAVSLLLSLG
jgi:oxidase EvaA